MADSIGNVFLAGEVQVGFNDGGTLARLTSVIRDVRTQIDAFNTFGEKSLKLGISGETMNQINALTDKFNQMKSAFSSFTFRDSDWAKIAGDMAELHHWMGAISNRTKELTKDWNAMKPNMYIPEIYISSLRAYNYELEKIKSSGNLIKAIGKYTPAAQVGVATSPTVPVTTPASVVTPTPSSGGGSFQKAALDNYLQEVKDLYIALEKVFQASKNTSLTEFFEANKNILVQMKSATKDFYELVDNKMGQAQLYIKSAKELSKEGYQPENALTRQKKDLEEINNWYKSGYIDKKKQIELLDDELKNAKNLDNVKKSAVALQLDMIKEAKKAAEVEGKELEIQKQKTAELEKQKFLNNARNIVKTGNLGQVEAEKIAVKQRIEQLSKSTVLKDKEELAILQKIIIALHEKENKLKASATATNTQNAHLALAEKFLKGNTAQERASAGLQLQNLTVREKELLLLAAKVKYGTGEIDQLQRRLGLQKGVESMLSDELKNWPAMLARQAIYGAQWTIIFGTIHRIQATLAAGVQIYKEFEKGTSRALRTGLTPTQLAGAFTSESQKGGSKETVNHYRELLQIQAMLFTSQHKAKVEDYMEAVYELTSANISLHNALKFTDTTMKVAIAAEGNITETTKILAGMYNIYKDSIKGVSSEQEKFNQIANTILVTWSREQVELSELNNAMKYVAASGRALNIDYRVLVTTIGHLNTHMIRSATSGTGLRQMMAQTSKDAGGLKDAFGEFSNDLIKFSKSQEAAFDPNKPTDFIAIMELMRKKLLANRKDFVDYGQDIIFTNKELSEAYKIMSLRGANVGLTLLRTLPELKRKIEETLNLSKNFTDEFIKIQERNLPQQWEIFIRNLQTVPAAFLLGVTHSQSIAEALSNVNEVMGKIIVGAFVVGSTITDWGKYLLDASLKLGNFFDNIGKFMIKYGGAAGGGIYSMGLGPMYTIGKDKIKDVKSEINNPQKLQEFGKRIEEFRKYLGLTAESQDKAGKTLDMSSKKFMENLNQRIEASNTESMTWINTGDYIQGTADSLQRYTQIYKELNSAYDMGQMGKVSGEFKKQQTYIDALNKTMEGQIDFYNQMKESNASQKTQFGFIDAATKQIDARSEKIDIASMKERENRRKALEDKQKYWQSYLEDPSKHLPDIQKEIQQRINAEDEYNSANQNILEERKRITEYYLKHGAGGELWEKIQQDGTLSETDSFSAAQSVGLSTDKLSTQRKRRANAYLDLSTYKSTSETLQKEKSIIISEKKKIAEELLKPENQVPVEYIALINDKVLMEKVKKEQEAYNKAAKNFANATGEMQKGMYRQMMKNSYDNINELLAQSPRFQSILNQVLNSEKNSDEVLQNIRSQTDQNVSKTVDAYKFFRDKLYKEIGMPGLSKEAKEQWKLKEDQEARLNMVNATLREKAQEKQNLRSKLAENTPGKGEADTPEMMLKREYYQKHLNEALIDYEKHLTMRNQLTTGFGQEDIDLQMKQKKEFDTLFMNEDTKKREGIKENYRQLMQQYEGDAQKQAQIQQQLNKELGELAVEQADKAIKEKQRVLDEIKKLKEEELKHAQTMAEQLLQIDKNKQIGLIKQAGLAEIEKLKASGKADPEAVKKIQEKVNAAIESMTGKYDVKEEELKQQQAGQSINQKQQEYNDLAKRFKDQKAQFEKADKDVSKLKTPAGKNREEWLITTPEYKRREELRDSANSTRSEMLKLSEEIGDLKITIQESAGKITDIKLNREVDLLTEPNYETQQMKKDMEIKYGINTPASGTGGIKSLLPTPEEREAARQRLRQQYKSTWDSGTKWTPEEFLLNTNKTIQYQPTTSTPKNGNGSSSAPGIETGMGGGSGTWVMAVNEFNKMENPYNSEKISLEQLKTMRNSRITQLTKEFNLLSQIKEVQKFGADTELGSYKNVGKVSGAIGQTFANILANQASIPRLNISNVFSQDKSLGQINAAIKAKEKGMSVGDLPGGNNAAPNINITIGDSSGPSKLPGHLENKFTEAGKEIVKYFEDMGALK